MRVVVISNDVTPGFGVPVAAPGLRAAGLAEGLRTHGHHVTTTVPADLLAQLFGHGVPPPPEQTHVVSPSDLNAYITEHSADVVVFINSNLTPHLDPQASVHYVYDLFAPKFLELEESGTATEAEISQLLATKARAMAMADSMWVNGARKLEYGERWFGRRAIQSQREEFARPLGTRPVHLVPMPVPLPLDISPDRIAPNTDVPRIGIAGYAQKWSSLDEVHPGHQMLIDRGFELHVLLPGHWGGNATPPSNALPEGVIVHDGPLEFDEFSRWVQSMTAMVDVFRPSRERYMAMITRSAVALRLGVPLIHAVDSEITDIVHEYDAGWVLDPDDLARWSDVCDALSTVEEQDRTRRGAVRASHDVFSPAAALAAASRGLERQVQRR